MDMPDMQMGIFPYEGQTVTGVNLNRKFNCSVNELFKWMVDPALIYQWFRPEYLKMGKVKTNLEAVDGTISELSLIQKFKIMPADMERRTKAWENMFTKLSENSTLGN